MSGFCAASGSLRQELGACASSINVPSPRIDFRPGVSVLSWGRIAHPDDGPSTKTIHGSYVASSGTFLLDNKIRNAANDTAAHTFETDNFPFHDATRTFREEAWGHYGLLFADTSGAGVAFVDPNADMPLYFSVIEGRGWVLSSRLDVTALVSGARVFDATGFWVPDIGHKTAIRRIIRLGANEALVFEQSRADLRKIKIPPKKLELDLATSSTIQSAVDKYATFVKQYFGKLGSFSVGLNTTGGLDTRTLLAALLATSQKPQLLYGVGNSKLTNTVEQDRRAFEKLTRFTALSSYQMNWNGSQPHDPDYLDDVWSRFGVERGGYSFSEGLIAEMSGSINPYPDMQMGGYSPAFTNNAPWNSSGAFGADSLIRSLQPVGRGFDLESEVAENVTGEIYEAIDELVSAGQLRPDWIQSPSGLLEFKVLASARASWGNGLFFQNFTRYLAPFLTRNLMDPLLTVKPEWRHKDEFQIRLIDSLDDSLLKVPVFSGLRPYEIDIKNFTGSRKSRTSMEKIADRLLPSAKKNGNADISPDLLRAWATDVLINQTDAGRDVRKVNGPLLPVLYATALRAAGVTKRILHR